MYKAQRIIVDVIFSFYDFEAYFNRKPGYHLCRIAKPGLFSSRKILKSKESVGKFPFLLKISFFSFLGKRTVKKRTKYCLN